MEIKNHMKNKKFSQPKHTVGWEWIGWEWVGWEWIGWEWVGWNERMNKIRNQRKNQREKIDGNKNKNELAARLPLIFSWGHPFQMIVVMASTQQVSATDGI